MVTKMMTLDDLLDLLETQEGGPEGAEIFLAQSDGDLWAKGDEIRSQGDFPANAFLASGWKKILIRTEEEITAWESGEEVDWEEMWGRLEE